MAMTAGDILYIIKADAKQFAGVMQKSAQGMRTLGVGMTALGASITATLGVAVTKWASYGDAIGKAAKRTGLSTEAISILGHAADQTGSSVETIEKAVKKMSTVIFEAGQGTATYTEALDFLGLKYEDLKDLKPEDQFALLSERIGELSNETDQAAIAQEIFGKAGTALIPLFEEGAAGMAAYAAEAKELGIVLDKDAAAKAELFTDTMDELKKSFQGAMIAIGPMIADLLIPLANTIKGIVVRIVGWIKANPKLAGTMTKVAAVVGVVMTALGPLLIIMPGIVAAFTAMSTVIPIIGAALAVLTGPIGIIAVAIAGITALIITFSDEIWSVLKPALQFIGDAFIWVGKILINILQTALWPVIEAFKLIIRGAKAVGNVLGFGGGGGGDLSAISGQTPTLPQGFAGRTPGSGGGSGGGVTIEGPLIQNANISGAQDLEMVKQELGRALLGELQAAGLAAGTA